MIKGCSINKIQNLLLPVCREMIKVLVFLQSHWIAFTILTLTVITTLSLWPQEQLPSLPGTDKIHHIIAYAALMFPIALRKPYKWIIYGLFFIAYSGAIELLQPYVNRYSEWLDMAANALGVFGGIIAAEFITLTMYNKVKIK